MNTVNVVRKEYRVPPNPICHIKVNGRGVFWSVSASVLKVADSQYPMQYLPRLSNGNDNQYPNGLITIKSVPYYYVPTKFLTVFRTIATNLSNGSNL